MQLGVDHLQQSLDHLQQSMAALQGLLEHEHKVLESIFPRHVIEYMTVENAGAGQRPQTSAAQVALHGNFWGVQSTDETVEKVCQCALSNPLPFCVSWGFLGVVFCC